jgi:hypothetical protein
MSRYQNPNAKLPRKAAMRMGKAIQPLFLEAQEAILDAQGEWREILSEEQKKLHDYDLQEMEKSFNDLDRRFKSWSEGKVTEEGGIFPAEREDRPPVDPKMPKPGLSSADKARAMNTEWWDGYVKDFIRNFELDDGQIASAQSILKDVKERAKGYNESRKADFARAQRKYDAAKKAKDLDKLNEAEEEMAQLNAFVPQLFNELKSRLLKIPRPAQMKKAESRQKDFRWDYRPIGTPVPTEKKSTPKPAKEKNAAKKTKKDADASKGDPQPKKKK